MNLLQSITDFFYKIFNWWFTVQPWEKAIHTRRGKDVRIKGPGFYWQIPFIDKVFIQTTRMRMVDIPMQTMTTKDGVTITVKSALGYAIDDIQKLYLTLYHPEITLCSMVLGKIGEAIRENNAKDISPTMIEESIHKMDEYKSYGLINVKVNVTTFAVVKTYRIMQEGSYMVEGLNMQPVTPQPR